MNTKHFVAVARKLGVSKILLYEATIEFGEKLDLFTVYRLATGVVVRYVGCIVSS